MGLRSLDPVLLGFLHDVKNGDTSRRRDCHSAGDTLFPLVSGPAGMEIGNQRMTISSAQMMDCAPTHSRPNHLGLWFNGLPSNTTALIALGYRRHRQPDCGRAAGGAARINALLGRDGGERAHCVEEAMRVD